jgi:hypothetical protein
LKEGFMLKKSLIFGTIALFLSALIAFTGCTQATDSDTTSSAGGRNSVYGSIDVYGLQTVIDKAVAANEPIYLEEGLVIEATAPDADAAWVNTINFKSVAVRINGEVTTTDRVDFNIARATVTGPGTIATVGDHIALGNDQPGAGSFVGGQLIQFGQVGSITPTAHTIAVAKYTYGQLPGYDYSTTPPVAINTKDVPITKIYVLDEVTIPSTTSIGSPDIAVVAFGDVNVIGTETALIAQDSSAFSGTPEPFKLGTSSTLTAKAGNADITIAATGEIPNIKVETAYPIRLKIATAGAFFTNRLSGPGTLTLLDAYNDGVLIDGGDGNVVFGDPDNNLVLTGTLVAGNTGKTTFNRAVTLGSGENLIGGDVVFKKGVNLTTGDSLALNGNVTLPNAIAPDVAYKIEFAKSASATALRTVTLAKDKSILVGGGLYSGSNAQAVVIEPVPVLTATDANLTLTIPAGGPATAALTASTAPSVTANDTVKAAAQRLYVDGGFAIKTGTLRVDTALGILDDSGIQTTDINDKISGAIALAQDASLLLAGNGYNQASIGETGKTVDGSGSGIVLGATALINGPATGNPAELKASGGTVILTGDSISSADKATLLAVGTPVATFETTGELILDGVTLDIKSNGILQFARAETTVKLTKSAGIIFAADGTEDERTIIQVGSGTTGERADVTNAVVKALTNKLASVTHNGGVAPATIKSRNTISGSLNLSKSGTNLAK